MTMKSRRRMKPKSRFHIPREEPKCVSGWALKCQALCTQNPTGLTFHLKIQEKVTYEAKGE